MTEVAEIKNCKHKFIKNISEEIIKILKDKSLYNEGLLYRRFSKDRINYVLNNGTDRNEKSDSWRSSYLGVDPQNILFCVEESPKKSCGSLDDIILTGVGLKEDFGISVYDSKELNPLFEHPTEDPAYYIPNNVRPLMIFKIKYE